MGQNWDNAHMGLCARYPSGRITRATLSIPQGVISFTKHRAKDGFAHSLPCRLVFWSSRKHPVLIYAWLRVGMLLTAKGPLRWLDDLNESR